MFDRLSNVAYAANIWSLSFKNVSMGQSSVFRFQSDQVDLMNPVYWDMKWFDVHIVDKIELTKTCIFGIGLIQNGSLLSLSSYSHVNVSVFEQRIS